MEFEPEDQEIVDLLIKIKNRDGKYPRKLLESRRQVFLSQMASVGLGLGLGTGLKQATKSSKGWNLAHLPAMSASTVVETLLVLVIVVQASIVAYNYRDTIADFVKSLSSTPTAVSIPVTGASQEDGIVSDTPTVIATDTSTPTPTTSPSSTVTTGPSQPGFDNGANSTADPAVTQAPPTNTNNGNHFGQTPKPTQQKKEVKPTQDTGNGNGNGKKP